MDNRYQMIYENANLENLERQIQSGYLTEASLKTILSQRELSIAEQNLIVHYKPEFAKIIEEAAPVGLDSRFKTWVMGKAPIASWNATAQGREMFAKKANNLKNEFLKYLASINKKIKTGTNKDLADFLNQQGYDVSKLTALTKLLRNPSNFLFDKVVNEIISDAVSLENSAKAPPSPLPTPSASPSPAASGTMDPAQVNALAAVLNKTTGKNNWGYLNTVGLIKKLKQAGVNISI